MDLSKHLGHGTLDLIKQSSHLVLNKNLDEPYVYKRHQDKVVMFLVLYIDDILLIGNDVMIISSVKV